MDVYACIVPLITEVFTGGTSSYPGPDLALTLLHTLHVYLHHSHIAFCMFMCIIPMYGYCRLLLSTCSHMELYSHVQNNKGG